MALILNIDTCTENAIVSLANNDVIIGTMNNSNQKDHASFLHTAIKNLLDKSGILISQLNAIAVTAGPGSYTGIRVGMAAAKGLAYALQIPLISLNTLEVIAMCSIIQSENKDAFFCPMIDARRMEVFTAVYDQFLKEIIAPCAMIIEKNSFDDILNKHAIIFSGSGVLKSENLITGKHALFSHNSLKAEGMALLSGKKFSLQEVGNSFDTNVLYIKEFYTM